MNNTYKVNMNLLPLVLILALIAGAGYLMTKGDVKIPFIKTNNRVEVKRLGGFPTTIKVQNEMDKKRLVIKSQEELDQFLKDVDKSNTLTIKDVNFDNEFLIVSTSQSYNMGGYSIKIKRIYDDKEKIRLLVLTEEIEPGETCAKTPEESYIAIDAVAIDKTLKDIDFEKVKKFEECN